MKSFGYINDQEYARNFIESRKDKKSRREIYASLCQKGVKSEDIDAAFQECYEAVSYTHLMPMQEMETSE